MPSLDEIYVTLKIDSTDAVRRCNRLTALPRWVRRRIPVSWAVWYVMLGVKVTLG